MAEDWLPAGSDSGPNEVWDTDDDGKDDKYAFAQTAKLQLLDPKLNVGNIERLDDEWWRASATCATEFSKLSPGDHTVDVDFRFRLVKDKESNQFGGTFPQCDTPLSTPFASGSFTLGVPEQPVTRRPLLKLEHLDCDKERTAAVLQYLNKHPDWGGRKNKREIPIAADNFKSCQAIDHESVLLENGRVKERPLQYGRDFTAVFRRRVADGWPSETIPVFDLMTCTVNQQNPETDIPPVADIAVGDDDAEIGVEYLSPEDHHNIMRGLVKLGNQSPWGPGEEEAFQQRDREFEAALVFQRGVADLLPKEPAPRKEIKDQEDKAFREFIRNEPGTRNAADKLEHDNKKEAKKQLAAQQELEMQKEKEAKRAALEKEQQAHNDAVQEENARKKAEIEATLAENQRKAKEAQAAAMAQAQAAMEAYQKQQQQQQQ